MTPIRFVGLALIVLIGFVVVSTQSDGSKVTSGTEGNSTRYVIIYNTVEPRINKKDADRRNAVVLIEKLGFTREGIIELSKLILKRYPRPELVRVEIFTDLKDVETPEEREMPKFSDIEGQRPTGNFAVIVRNEQRAFAYLYYADGNFLEVTLDRK